ncbi:ATP-binding protein [Deinococcus malanensis]|uniref:sensor histidine kinase n=2 Tax=Deinococcus malanensis TaxID=1706855 RepID=UPI0036314A71
MTSLTYAGSGRASTDITPYKQAHQTLLNGHAVLDHQIESGTARVRALNDELEQVVTSVLQELYLPASRVMSALGLLRQALGDRIDDVEKPVLHVERGGQQLLAIIHSVERYMQARRFRTRLRTVDLRHVLHDVLQRNAPLLANRQVEITYDPLPTVMGDSQALTIILEEYIANALKYTRTRAEARLHLHVRETEAEFVIGVEDNGVGFDMRHKERLFRLFQRQHPSSVYEGSGLGLAVVRRVTERFGGRAWGEGAVDRGSTFWFAWPRQPTVHA